MSLHYEALNCSVLTLGAVCARPARRCRRHKSRPSTELAGGAPTSGGACAPSPTPHTRIHTRRDRRSHRRTEAPRPPGRGLSREPERHVCDTCVMCEHPCDACYMAARGNMGRPGAGGYTLTRGRAPGWSHGTTTAPGGWEGRRPPASAGVTVTSGPSLGRRGLCLRRCQETCPLPSTLCRAAPLLPGAPGLKTSRL